MRFVQSSFAFTGRRLALPSLHDVLWWVLAAAIAVLGAALLWTMLTPTGPLGNWRPASVRVMSPSARAALFAAMDPFNRDQQPAALSANATVTALALTLFGTRSTPGGQGTAIIAGADGTQKVYRVGSEVMPGVMLAEVAFDHIVLGRSGGREMLYLDQSKAAPSADSLVAAAPSALGAPPSAPTGPLTVDAARQGIAFSPRAEGGKVVGLEVQPSADGNAFRSAGFQQGDIITAVNGKPVAGAGDGAALAGALKPGASVSVTVRRGDRNLPLAITLAP